eukprot:TRINITY_DN858_c1_g1_i2.p1 TRINITY_DN858_c1_g1~~TRINITY_DN858_c1_g1_i2.p1  ORF type:complete len:269 (+),score=62.17 TRINITY_DN858_c1_g1_i2:62-868(+)
MSLVLFEHVNIGVRSDHEAMVFCDMLGCVKADKSIGNTLHMNCGAVTQFHLPVSEGQDWRGVVEVGYGTEQECVSVLERAKEMGYDVEDGVVKGLGGTDIKIVVGDDCEAVMDRGIRKGAVIGPGRPIGIVGCTIDAPPGSAQKIARFYRNLFNFQVHTPTPTVCTIPCGPLNTQHITFTETPCPRPYSGEHLCIYISNLIPAYRNCAKQGIIWVNPRFIHIEAARTEDEAMATHGFRIINIVDLETKEVLMELEHEVRGPGHKAFPY